LRLRPQKEPRLAASRILILGMPSQTTRVQAVSSLRRAANRFVLELPAGLAPRHHTSTLCSLLTDAWEGDKKKVCAGFRCSGRGMPSQGLAYALCGNAHHGRERQCSRLSCENCPTCAFSGTGDASRFARAGLASDRNRRFQRRRPFRHPVSKHQQRPGLDLGNGREQTHWRRASLGCRPWCRWSPTIRSRSSPYPQTEPRP
jgi:hypothetical protein